ncbi:MAG: hypothetical protein RIM84_18855 [Alphaproteobacteria bacterium]
MQPPVPARGPSPQGGRQDQLLVPAADAALALLRLQQRIVDLERENDFLRGCIPATAVATPGALAVVNASSSNRPGH